MKKAVGANELAAVDGALAEEIGGLAAGFFDDETERGEVPGHGGPVDGGVDGAFGDEHVLPEAAKSATVTGGVGKFAESGAVGGIFLGSGAGGENHGVGEGGGLRDLDFFVVAEGAFAAVGAPAGAEGGSADHAGDDFAIFLDAEKDAEGGNAAGKFLGAVDGIDDQASAAVGVCGFHVEAAHFLAENVEREAAGGDLFAGHLFNLAVGLGDDGAVFLAIDAGLDGAEVARGDEVAVLDDGFEERMVGVAVAQFFPR